MLKGLKAKMITGVALVASTLGLTISGSTVTVDSADLTSVSNSVNSLLTTSFETLKFLPYIALIIGGFYLLNKIFSVVKSAGGSGN